MVVIELVIISNVSGNYMRPCNTEEGFFGDTTEHCQER